MATREVTRDSALFLRSLIQTDYVVVRGGVVRGGVVGGGVVGVGAVG